MPEVKLSEILNLQLDPRKRRINRALPEFMASLLGEYAVGHFAYDENDGKAYSYIRKFFSTNEMSSTDLIQKLKREEGLWDLYNEFPSFDSEGTAAYDKWKFFLEESLWCERDGETAVLLNGNKYQISKGLLRLVQGEDGYYLQRYHQEGGRAVYRNIGTDAMEQSIAGPAFFEQFIHKQITGKEGGESFHLSEEQFFQNEIIQSADERQREAITSDTLDNLVVLAGAGSGKTRTLCCRLAYLHLVKSIPLNKILLLTFTTAAAKTMREQSKQIMEPFYITHDISDSPEVNAKTIDAFAIQLLRSFYWQMGFTTKPALLLDSTADVQRARNSMVHKIIRENNLEGVFNHYFRQDEDKGIGYLMRDLLNYAAGVPINHAGFDLLLERYLDEQRRQNKVMGFVEASLFVKAAMEEPQSALAEHIKKSYSCILIDEFQDISVLQNSIFKPLYRSAVHFTFVGDDDQAIYYWRGSDSEIVRELTEYNNVKTLYLITNYRNNPNIVEAGNKVLHMIPNRAKKGQEIHPNRSKGDRIVITEYDDKYTNLVNEVSRVLRSQPAEEICILARERASVKAICDALKASGIPYVVQQTRLSTATSNYRLMRAILNILNQNNVAASAKEIKMIRRCEGVTDRKIRQIVTGKCAEKDCPEELLPVKQLSDELLQSAPMDLANAVYNYAVKAAELFEEIIYDRPSDPIFEVFEDFCKNKGAPWPTPKKQLNGIFEVFENDIQASKSGGGTAIAHGVRVDTFHAAKGLEYNVIFITGLSDNEYNQANLIETTYSARKSQLRTLQEARIQYYRLRETVTEEMLDSVLASCANPAFSRSEKEVIEQVEQEIRDLRHKLMDLSADGVEEYLDIYASEIQPLERQYKADYDARGRMLLIEKAKAEEMEEEIALLEDESPEKATERMKDLAGVRDKILSIECEMNRLRNRALRFSKTISGLREFSNTCFAASGYLADMAKEEDAEELLRQAEDEKRKRLDEEWRLYYVAITRARDHLYLCHLKGTAPSQFIKIIDEKLTRQYTMLTDVEEEEIQRLSQAMHKEMEQIEEQKDNGAPVDETKLNEYSDKLLSSKSFEQQVKDNKKVYYDMHPVFRDLSAKAKPYFDRAIGLLALSELLKENYNTEIAHNLQTMAKMVLSSYSGDRALPYKTQDEKTAKRIYQDIWEVANKYCETNPPGKDWVVRLLMEKDRYSSEMKELKSLAINHFAVRSGKYPVPEEIRKTWLSKGKLDNPNKFMAAALNLANTRNKLVHDQESQTADVWSEDVIPRMLQNAERIVSMSHADPRLLDARDAIEGKRVKHEKYGYGRITAVDSGRFYVDFDNGPKGEMFFVPRTVDERFHVMD